MSKTLFKIRSLFDDLSDVASCGMEAQDSDDAFDSLDEAQRILNQIRDLINQLEDEENA